MFGEALSESRVETQTEEDKERLEEKEAVREIHKGGVGGGKPAPPGSGVQRSRAVGREGAEYVEQQGGRNN